LRSVFSGVFGLQYGDEGKGKITAAMAASRAFSLVARYNGGPNAGHTIMVDDKVVKTRQLPCGVLYGIASYIGPGTVLDLAKLNLEVEHVSDTLNIDVRSKLIIDPRVPLIEEEEIEQDKLYYSKNGTASTGSGIAPAYSKYYARKANLVGDRSLTYKVSKIDFHKKAPYKKVLLEGAQGFWLDIIHGEYPNTTSSHCNPTHAATSFGFSPYAFNRLVGVAKCYETRSGVDDNFMRRTNYFGSVTYANPDDINHLPGVDIEAIYDQVQVIGGEFGVNTGRKRACKPLDLSRLAYAVNASGATEIVIQKLDVLRKLNAWYLYQDSSLFFYENEADFKNHINNYLKSECVQISVIHWLDSPKATWDRTMRHFIND